VLFGCNKYYILSLQKVVLLKLKCTIYKRLYKLHRNRKLFKMESSGTSYLDDEEVFVTKEQIKITSTPAASENFTGLHEKVEELDERVSTVETHVGQKSSESDASAKTSTHARSKSVDNDITKFM